MAFAALSSYALPLSVAGGTLTLFSIAWFVRLPRLALSFLLLSLVTGQLIRLPLPGQGGGLLPSDLAVVVILIIAGIRIIFKKPIKTKTPSVARFIFLLIIPFISWSLFTLFLRASSLGISHTAIAFSYWLRLSANLLLLPALVFLLNTQSLSRLVARRFNVASGLIILIGLIQLAFFPDISMLAKAGWDPHQSRLVSTWLDPNFLGIFLVLILPLPSLWSSRWRYPALILITLSLMATQSRSALLAAGITALVLSPLALHWYFRRPNARQVMTIISLIGLSLAIIATILFFLGPRLSGLLTLDATVELRLASLSNGWRIVTDHPFLGVGYNAYQFASGNGTSAANYSIHSRAGADNSLLTIWATTGIFGLSLFLLPWSYLLCFFFVRLLRHSDARALVGLFGISALFAHSQFINSFLYSHLLIALAIIIALIIPRS